MLKILILPLNFAQWRSTGKNLAFLDKHFVTRKFSDNFMTTDNLLWATAPPPGPPRFVSLPRRHWQWIKSNRIKILLNRIVLVVSWIKLLLMAGITVSSVPGEWIPSLSLHWLKAGYTCWSALSHCSRNQIAVVACRYLRQGKAIRQVTSPSSLCQRFPYAPLKAVVTKIS